MGSTDLPKVLRFFEDRPVDSVLARVAVEEIGLSGYRGVAMLDSAKEISSFSWDYGNIIPLGFDEPGLDALAGNLLSRWRTATSLVGPQDQVLGLWERLSNVWGPAREVRERQYSMVMGDELLVRPDPLVRPASPSDFPAVFPASVAMYIEEVGYDPTIYGRAYEQRAYHMVIRGHTFIRTGPALDGPGERVIFKADVGAFAGGVAQLQGVWVAPDLRGQGIATAGIAATVGFIRALIAPTISLYVNDYNEAAVAVYRKVGFDVAGEWSTVLMA